MTTVVMQWNGEQGHYQYILCNPPMNMEKHAIPKDINLVLLSQRLPREAAAKLLNIPLKQLP